MSLIGTGLNNTSTQGLSGLLSNQTTTQAVGITTTTNNWVNNTAIGTGTGLSGISGGHHNIAIGYSALTNGQNQDMIDFFELVLVALGYDVDYSDFCKMSKAEKKSLLRDIKIKRLIS